MRAGRVVMASAAVHAALFGALSRITIEGKHAAQGVPPKVDVVPPPEPAVFDVVVLDSPPSPAGAITAPPSSARAITAPPAVDRAGATRGREGQRVATSTTTSTIPEADGQGHGHGQGHGMMGMRGPDLGLAAGTADRIIATSRPLPKEAKISGELQNAPGGRAIHDDAVTTMNVDADGSVTFHDKPDIEIKLKLPIPHLDPEEMRKDLGKLITDWYRDPDANKKFGPKGMVSRVILAVPGSCDSWGDVWCDDALAPKSEQYAREQKKTGGSLFGGKLDITAYL
ncbi:MAG: hypothetical protein HOV81_22465, partial [Kofleriaceae bacterium]|nr:hypothetical protein [Kofleriaceae bacterium]